MARVELDRLEGEVHEARKRVTSDLEVLRAVGLSDTAIVQAVGIETARRSVAEVLQKVQSSQLTVQDISLHLARQAFADAIHIGFRLNAVIVLAVTGLFVIFFAAYPGPLVSVATAAAKSLF